VANGIMTLNLASSKPVIFGVLTPNDMQQALDRSGGKHGNKGVESAMTALKMVALAKSFKSSKKGIGY
jgi:6,7-dimethyl-8-ribityllumazine synthase